LDSELHARVVLTNFAKKFLGHHINNFLTAEAEIVPFKNNLTKLVNTTRACNSLSKIQRMKIAREQIFSRFSTLVFLFVYLSDNQVDQIRSAVKQAFKRASYIPPTASTEYVENAMFGMTFTDYVKYRFLRVATRMQNDKSDLFNNIYRSRNGKGKWRKKRGTTVGTFIQTFINLANDTLLETRLKESIKNKKKTKKIFFHKLIRLKFEKK
jgi:hypothetical protein